jgi:hypothetical protein
MPIAGNGIIQVGQERLQASLQAARESIRLPLLTQGAVLAQELESVEKSMRETIERGVEQEQFLRTLADLRPRAERGVEFFRSAMLLVEGDPSAVLTIESQLGKAKDFLAWIVDLESHAVRRFPPFDESKLPEEPTGPTAEGFLSIQAARAWVRRAKSEQS